MTVEAELPDWQPDFALETRTRDAIKPSFRPVTRCWPIADVAQEGPGVRFRGVERTWAGEIPTSAKTLWTDIRQLPQIGNDSLWPMLSRRTAASGLWMRGAHHELFIPSLPPAQLQSWG